LAELARRGIATRDEIARTLLRQRGGMGLRERDPDGFGRAMFAAEQARWQEIAEAALQEPVVCDRGWPDIAGFLRLEGRPVPAELDRACRTLRYAEPVFRAPPWRAIYSRDEERIQSWREARESDAAVCAAWREYGYALVDLPLVPLGERAEFVLERLAG
jgi:predicted ATPase